MLSAQQSFVSPIVEGRPPVVPVAVSQWRRGMHPEAGKRHLILLTRHRQAQFPRRGDVAELNSRCRLDVLIDAEKVLWIVFLFHNCKARIVLAEACLESRGTLIVQIRGSL